MNTSKKSKNEKQEKATKADAKTLAYRLECEKTANGLSHFVMYGDVQKNKALL